MCKVLHIFAIDILEKESYLTPAPDFLSEDCLIKIVL